MDRFIEITSKENPRFRSLVTLHDRKAAREQGKVFIEGLRLCEDALKSGLCPETVVVRKDKLSVAEAWAVEYKEVSGSEILVFSDTLFSKLCKTVNPQGIAMVVGAPVLDGTVIKKTGSCRYIVLEHLQDPGNMGTIIRMADAFSYDAVLFTEDSVDPYNEKVLRASMGSCFHIPLISYPDAEAIFRVLTEKSITSIGAHLHGEPLSKMTFPDRKALWIGNEANGLTESTSGQCDILVKIEMTGRAESLNAASAASILGYILAQ